MKESQRNGRANERTQGKRDSVAEVRAKKRQTGQTEKRDSVAEVRAKKRQTRQMGKRDSVAEVRAKKRQTGQTGRRDSVAEVRTGKKSMAGSARQRSASDARARQEAAVARIHKANDAAARKRQKEKLRAKEERLREKDGKRGNAQILFVTYCITIIFLCMAGYMVHFMVTQSQEVINNPYNKRQEVLAKKVQKGKILSADGKVLAKTVTDEEGKDTRVYPYDDMFCHIVGRTTNSMTGIEGRQCYPLLTSHANPLTKLTDTFRGEKTPGDNVVTTLHVGLQKAAYDALGNQKGAVVALEPSTGKILAMVSKPAYDPNYVAKNWEALIADSNEESALVNRATQGLYPPGSTFKMLTTMEYLLEQKDTYSKFRYQCQGSDSFLGNVINCYAREKHGSLNLKSAFAKSCNGAFAQIGTTLDVKSFGKLAEKFLFNKSLPVDFEYNKSQFSLTEDSDMGELTQTVMGQGKTMITPLENAMITATIANGGSMMIPYVVERVENEAGQTVTSYEPKKQGRIVDEWVAEKMNRLMCAVVTEGTGRALNSLSYAVAGKTGSAEYDSEGSSHAWFVGFAPADDPKIAVSIIVEGAGTGSQYAVPIAREMFEAYLGN